MYILNTKLFCGHCGAYMVGESGTGRNGIHQYYKCVSVKKHRGCKKKTVQKSKVEDIVIAETMAMLQDENVIKYIVDMIMNLQKKENTTLPMLQKQLVETDKGIENIVNAIQQGIFTSSTKNRLDELEANKTKLEIAIAQEEIQKPSITK